MDAGGQDVWLQCQSCGEIHKEKIGNYDIENDIFLRLKCSKCRDSTSQLILGADLDDLYLYTNVNVDPRYY